MSSFLFSCGVCADKSSLSELYCYQVRALKGAS